MGEVATRSWAYVRLPFGGYIWVPGFYETSSALRGVETGVLSDPGRTARKIAAQLRARLRLSEDRNGSVSGSIVGLAGFSVGPRRGVLRGTSGPGSLWGTTLEH